MSARATLPWGELDEALERLRVHTLPYRWCPDDLRLWEAACPVCKSPGWDLMLREPYRGAAIGLRCNAGGCSSEEIWAALNREPVEPRVDAALELAERAADVARLALELRTAA